MNRKELEKSVRTLLNSSTIAHELKQTILTDLDSLHDEALLKIYQALAEEVSKMADISEQKKRVEFKYRVMVEKMCELKLKE